jgi:capsular polysaccharide biosynthesis protein
MSDAQPLLDLQKLVLGVRRRWRLVGAFALLGLLAGAVLAVLVPAPPTAVTRLLVIHENDQPSDTGGLINTDIALLQTTRIAAAALKSLHSTESPEEFLKSYSSTGLTSNVLELTVHGTSDVDAVAKAKALAEVFIADTVQRVQAAADAESQALINQRDQAQAELAQVDAAIAATPETEDGSTATQLESLYSRRAELSSKVTDLTGRAEEAGIGAPRVKAGTRIVDAPRPVDRSSLIAVGTNAGVGFALGLGAGLVLAAIAGVVRDRPVLRRDIAEQLGASVVAQLPGPRRRLGRARWAAERRRVAGTLRRLIGTDRVSLLELGAPAVTAALVLDLAEELADERPVVVVEDRPGRVVADDPPGRERAEHLPIAIAEDAPEGSGRRVLGIGSVMPGTAWTDLERLGTRTVLVVRTGHADTAWLHTVARQLSDCAIPILGVVVVDPDPRDRTDGTLWDGLHTALRGRARHERRTNGKLADAEATVRFTPVSLSARTD